MMTQRIFFRRLSIALIVSLAAGCNSPSGQSVSPLLENATTPPASGHDLLYIASPGYGGSAPGKLRLFTYPQAQHRRTAQADTYPARSCADERGNVYIPYNTYGSIYGYIFVYAHGHAKPERSISNGYYFNFSDCAADPTSGNLAVTFGAHGILIYPHAKGKPTYYAYPPNLNDVSGCTYDDRGNLFVGGVGTRKRYPLRLYELPPGQSTFNNIKLPHIHWPSNTPGDLHWDGKHLAWANGGASIYRLAVSGSEARIAGVTTLEGTENYLSFFWVQGGSVVAPTLRSVRIWNYPAGGKTTATIPGFGYVAVSVPP